MQYKLQIEFDSLEELALFVEQKAMIAVVPKGNSVPFFDMPVVDTLIKHHASLRLLTALARAYGKEWDGSVEALSFIANGQKTIRNLGKVRRAELQKILQEMQSD